ncbi:response regulator [Azospirillum sp. B506]|uniref:response regulator n=1 Tax=Azospirillum sp. B506 TaxID=137721 RepID=UPI0003461F00|nr:response regulator [Azospirillum sp. B506]
MTKRPAAPIKILIVDDNPLLQRALKDMLGLWGVGQITAVGNGQDAKDALRREVFDLMVTDWVMEPVGGAQLVQWIRQSPGSLASNMPIIVLDRNAELAHVRSAWDAGARFGSGQAGAGRHAGPPHRRGAEPPGGSRPDRRHGKPQRHLTPRQPG